jgi:hypothetical protein
MKLRPQGLAAFASLLLFPLALTNCVISESDLENAVAEANSNSNAYGQQLTSVNGQGRVTIMEGSRTVATCYTASPNIEQTRWVNEQQQIVVKSRGNHGPATVQLFNSRTGRQEGTVMAYELANGGPAWATGMAD